MTPSAPKAGIRWWPAALILIVASLVLIKTWVGEAPDRQDQVIVTLVTGGLAVIALILWWLLFSRLPAKVRLVSLAVLLGVGALAASTLRYRELSGDLVPIFEWRWAGASSGDAAEASTAIPPAPAGGSDYPQYLGPRRDGAVIGVHLARDWSASPPVQLWRQPIGSGWSGFAVAGSLAVTSERQGDEDRVSCYELTTGALRWTHVDPMRFDGGVMDGPGPRATPAIEDGRVYALDAAGRLNALDLSTGRLLWTRDVVQDNSAAIPLYGVSASPLLLDGRVVVLAGGAAGRSLVAYDQLTGERAWSGGSAAAAYSSPQLATLAGRRQVVVFSQVDLVGHDAASGEVLWNHPWPGGAERCSTPLALPDDQLFASTGYGIGSKLFRIEAGDDGAFTAQPIWESPRLKAKFTNVVYSGGVLYGLDDGVLVALDPATGERHWKRGRYGHGHVILVDDLLLVQTEKGEVVLVEASPERHVELGRFEAITGKSWNTPALAGRFLLVRNATEAACYELPVDS